MSAGAERSSAAPRKRSPGASSPWPWRGGWPRSVCSLSPYSEVSKDSFHSPSRPEVEEATARFVVGAIASDVARFKTFILALQNKRSRYRELTAAQLTSAQTNKQKTLAPCIMGCHSFMACQQGGNKRVVNHELA